MQRPFVSAGGRQRIVRNYAQPPGNAARAATSITSVVASFAGYTSGAEPSTHTKPDDIATEDDVLHLWTLPSFSPTLQGETITSGVGLGQQDAELLLGFLTVPYLRIPLVASFFASEDRIHSLQSPALQRIFIAVLFEPGAHLPAAHAGMEPTDVPTSSPELLASAQHLLINELRRSPSTLCESIVALARQAVLLDTGTASGSTTTIILFVARLCAHLDSYLTMMCDRDANSRPLIVPRDGALEI